MDNNIKNIVFDLGGVLADLDFDKSIDAFRKAGFKDIGKQISKFSGTGFFYQFELGNISAEEFREEIRKHINKPLTDQKIDEMWNMMLVNIPHTKLDLLLELRGQYMVYLLSNTNQIHWDYASKQMFKYRGFQVNDFFEDTFLSFQLHQAKPSKEVFKQMMEEANILPEETFFIDDSETNCEAAVALGIPSYHYHTGEDLSVLFEL